MIDRARIMVEPHALESYRRFYPAADGRDFLDAASSGPEIEAGEVAGLTGRAGIYDVGTSVYSLHPERTGIFVFARMTERMVGWYKSITFLRFYSLHQYETAARLWPGGGPVTATGDATWVRAPNLVDDPPAPEPRLPKKEPPPSPKTRSEPGSAISSLVGATRVRVQLPLPGGIATVDTLAREGRFRRVADAWVAVLDDGSVVVVSQPNATRPNRWVARWTKGNRK